MPAIAWLPWSAASFARARTERKPVLLSIAPTWCRNSVEMDRSSFADPDVVARVGLRYVAIRVDADRRPDISERYSLGGWPTTAFLTPDGGVLGGGTYVDHHRLAETLERAEGRSCASFVESRAALHPSSGACWIEVAGAYAMFDTPTSPVTQTFGLGMFQTPTDADMARIETFFAERGAPVFHEVSPLAGEAMPGYLALSTRQPFETAISVSDRC